ncbi:MAG: methyltransferase type 12 [Rhizobiales bacterium]|nr:methyltransferase type 12 [Hyphomicrobiales bacterium]MBA69220.1 methyltransferase type 12 [Hyphomicrobiales bacterium]
MSAYVGDELSLFAHASNWKNYWSSMISPFLGETVLDVGAGLGSTIRAAAGPKQKRWVAIEPDDSLAEELRAGVGDGTLPSSVEVVTGTLDAVEEKFHSVLYIDVLEHIEDDKTEMQKAIERVLPGGNLIVLSPAHQFLYTPFDEGIGHFRRYSKATLSACQPDGSEQVLLRYLDGVGIAASLANRMLLQQSMPTQSQIAKWDKFMVPVSRVIDPMTGYHIGKSVLAVWRRVK